MNVQAISTNMYNSQPLRSQKISQNLSFGHTLRAGERIVEESAPLLNEASKKDMAISLNFSQILNVARMVGDYTENPENPEVNYVGKRVTREVLEALQTRTSLPDYLQMSSKKQLKTRDKFVQATLKQIQDDYINGQKTRGGGRFSVMI